MFLNQNAIIPLGSLLIGMEFEKYEPVPENVAETIQAKK